MLPISLTIKGINSYQKETTIDFEKLMQRGLFGVFGKVGGGKSTVIDAISLALYDKTEKLGGNDKRNYNLMNLQSKELLIDFVFAAGKNLDQKYRFVVQGKREKKFDDVKTFSRASYLFQNNEWIPNEDLKAEEILNLSYENFKRTIMIPQGQFKEFLELGDKDRTTMLKQIFNLHKFEFYQEITDLEKTDNAKKNQLEGSLSQLIEYSEELLESKKTAGNLVAKDLKEADEQLKKISNEWSEINQQKENFGKLNNLRIEAEKLSNQQSEINTIEKELKDYELCFNNFKPLFEAEEKSKIEEISLEKIVDSLNADFTKKVEKQSAFTLKNKELLNNKNKNDFETELNDWKAIFKIQKIEKNSSDNLQKLQETELLLTEIEKAINDNAQALEKDEIELQKLKENTPDLTLINELDKWFLELKNLEQKSQEYQQKIEKLQETIKNGAEEKETLINNSAINQDLKNELHKHKITPCFEILNQEKIKLESKENKLKTEKQNLVENQGLFKYSEALKNGEACPLCGAEEHPNPLTAHNPAEEIKLINSKILSSEKEGKAILDLEYKLNSLKDKSLEKLNSKKEEEGKFEAQENLISKHKTQKPNLNLSIEELAAKKAEIANNQLIKENLEKEITNKRKLEKQFQAQINEANENSKTLRETTNTAKGEIATYKAQIQGLNIEIAKKEAADLKIQTIEKTLLAINENETILAQLEKEIIAEEANLKAKKEELEKVSNEHKKAFSDLNNIIEKSAFRDIKTAHDILNKKIDIDSTKKRINDYKIALEVNTKQIKELEKQLKNKSFSEEYFANLNEQKQTLEQETSDLNQQFGAYKISITDIEKKLKEKQILEAENKVLQGRLEDQKVLKKMFYKSGFVNYVSSIYLRELCHAANKRFTPLTHNQMNLEINEANHFVVRDHLNGGKIRLAKTLSGGQKFQASLSLALALAERVSKRQFQPKHFFFIDEGFGALDQESLQQVYETLQSLTKENKIVGVISHMEALQENITNYLYIKNDDQEGSLVEMNG